MLLFGIGSMTLVASYTGVHFLGSALTFMMVYVWGRRNEDVKMSFLGFFTFHGKCVSCVCGVYDIYTILHSSVVRSC
jgi:hypothetical protein